MKFTRFLTKSMAIIAVVIPVLTTPILAKPSAEKQRVIDFWTAERMAQAQPRDLRLDKKTGLGYLRNKDGSFKPYGHNKLYQLDSKTPNAKPGGGGGGNNDSTPPTVNHIEPADGTTIGASQRFAANITDASGIRSATLIINPPSGPSQTFAMSNSAGDVWESNLQGFTTSTGWSWQVEAADTAKRGGNKITSSAWSFDVDTGSGGGTGGGGGGTGGDVITNDRWTDGGDIQFAAGRLFYQMPTNSRLKRWAGYVCSGTVVTDGTSGRSVIITAAHCVYDDANKAFARNVLFIPNQDQTTGSGTNSNCADDPIGCWVADFGVVDVNWTTATFPDNIPYDYAYYVVSDTGSYDDGTGIGDGTLDTSVNPMTISFSVPSNNTGSNTADNSYTHGMGYSYSDDPNFMYCAENMTTEGPDNWWLSQCGLSGGSSGGPWIQPMNGGKGPLISVNSWGYGDTPGMAGPFLNDNSAECLFAQAKAVSFSSVSSQDGREGITVTNCP